MTGLDNITADGVTAIETLHKVIDKNEDHGTISVEWCHKMRQTLTDTKAYLNSDSRIHLNMLNMECKCPDHCIGFALGSPTDKKLQNKCRHKHDEICAV